MWPQATQALLAGLLALAGAAPLGAAAVALAGYWLGTVVLGGHLALWASYLRLGQPRLAATDALEVTLLVALLAVLPPMLSAGVYFVFWHSLQHVLRMNALLAPARRPGRPLWVELGVFLKRAAPLLALSVVALAALYAWEWPRTAGSTALVSLALLAASVVTLPHALLVTLALDATRWRPVPRQPRPALGQ